MLIEGSFDAFITVDRNLPAQHAVTTRAFGVVVLRTPSNRLQALIPLVPEILAALATLRAGEVIVLPVNTN